MIMKIKKLKVMNKMMIKYLMSFFFFFALFVACNEEQRRLYYDEDAPAPVAVDHSSVTIENYEGWSVLRYKVPDDENLLYVRAEYESAPGVVRHSKSSRFTDTIGVQGFIAAGDYEVKLFSVGKNEKESAPVTVTVSPLTPPVVEAFPSLYLIAVFGGVEGYFTNPSGQPLKVTLLMDSVGGELQFVQSYTIDNPEAKFTLRGLPVKEMRFAAYLTDRWGNRTETKEYTLTPMFEERLDKKLWKEHKLPSDFDVPYSHPSTTYQFKGLFDDIICPMGSYGNIFVFPGRPFPQTFTLDLGVEANLSRFNLIPWWSHIYLGFPRIFELYGSASGNPGDDINGGDWQLIGKFQSWKPSGENRNLITQEDKDYIWPGGENYDVKPSEDVPDPYFSVRMLRIRVLETWNGGGFCAMDELTIWGGIAKVIEE